MDVFEFRERREVRADDDTEKLANAVIACAIEVHPHLGPGLPEITYRRSMSRELTLDELVGEGRVDILVAGELVVEIKVAEVITKSHVAQTIAYLQALKLQLGLILNFNVTIMKDGIRRVINTF